MHFSLEKPEASFCNFTRQYLFLVGCFSLFLSPVLWNNVQEPVLNVLFLHVQRVFSSGTVSGNQGTEIPGCQGLCFLSVAMDGAGRGPGFLLLLPGFSQLVVFHRKLLKKEKPPCTCFQTAVTEHPGWAIFEGFGFSRWHPMRQLQVFARI